MCGSLEGNFEWVFSEVYNPNQGAVIKLLWVWAIGGIYLGALVGILMSLDSRVRARERRFTPAMGSFLISFLNRGWWIYHYWEEGSLCLVIRKLLPCSDLICSWLHHIHIYISQLSPAFDALYVLGPFSYGINCGKSHLKF